MMVEVKGGTIRGASPMVAMVGTTSMVGTSTDMAGAEVKLGGSYIALYITIGICLVLGVVLGVVLAKRAANK